MFSASPADRGGICMPISTAEGEVKSSANSEYSYEKDFLTKQEADALLALARSLPRERPMNKLSGFKYGLRRLQMPCYSATPNWRGSENEKTNQWMMPLDEARLKSNPWPKN